MFESHIAAFKIQRSNSSCYQLAYEIIFFDFRVDGMSASGESPDSRVLCRKPAVQPVSPYKPFTRSSKRMRSANTWIQNAHLNQETKLPRDFGEAAADSEECKSKSGPATAHVSTPASMQVECHDGFVCGSCEKKPEISGETDAIHYFRFAHPQNQD